MDILSVYFSDNNLSYSLQNKQENGGTEPGHAPPPLCFDAKSSVILK